MSATREDLGAHLRTVREDADLTRRQLGDAIGLQPGSISAIERGTARTLAATVHRWLDACGHDDPADRDRWIDPYRMLLRDARRDINAGFRLILDWHWMTRGWTVQPHARRRRGGRLYDGPRPWIDEWDPERGDEFRAAVKTARDAITAHHRAELDAMIARTDRLLARHNKARPPDG